MRFTSIHILSLHVLETHFYHAMSCLQCSVTCGSGVRTRLIECPQWEGCDPTERPSERVTCNAGECEVAEWVTGPWSEVSELLRRTVVHFAFIHNCVVNIFYFYSLNISSFVLPYEASLIVFMRIPLPFRTPQFGTKMCPRRSHPLSGINILV